MSEQIDSQTTLPFTQEQYDSLASITGIGRGLPGRFYKTSTGVTEWVQGRADGGYTSDPNRGYWLDFNVTIVDPSYFDAYK